MFENCSSPIVIVLSVCYYAGKLLMVNNMSKDGVSFWTLPLIKHEAGETFEESASMGLFSDFNLTLDCEQLPVARPLITFEALDYGTETHFVCVVILTPATDFKTLRNLNISENKRLIQLTIKEFELMLNMKDLKWATNQRKALLEISHEIALIVESDKDIRK